MLRSLLSRLTKVKPFPPPDWIALNCLRSEIQIRGRADRKLLLRPALRSHPPPAVPSPEPGPGVAPLPSQPEPVEADLSVWKGSPHCAGKWTWAGAALRPSAEIKVAAKVRTAEHGWKRLETCVLKSFTK